MTGSNRPFRLLALIGVLSFFALETRSTFAAETKDWNILIYASGKNNLENDIQKQLVELEQTQGSTERVNILVEFGGINFADVIRYQVKKPIQFKKKLQNTVLQHLGGSTDMGDWHTFVSFVAWAKKNYPAKHTMVVISDHGNVWTGANKPIMSIDEETGHGFKPHQVTMMLDESAKILGAPIDLLLYDLCLLNSLEMMGESQGSVNFYVASRETIPGDGVNYATLLSKVVRNARKSPREIAYLIVQDAKNNSSHSQIYYSGMNLKMMPAFAKELKTLVDQILKLSTESQNKIRQSILNADLTPVRAVKGYVDFRDLFKAIQKAHISQLDDQLDRTREALYRFFFDSSDSVEGGISIMFDPNVVASEQKSKEYHNLRFDRKVEWLRMVKWMKTE